MLDLTELRFEFSHYRDIKYALSIPMMPSTVKIEHTVTIDFSCPFPLIAVNHDRREFDSSKYMHAFHQFLSWHSNMNLIHFSCPRLHAGNKYDRLLGKWKKANLILSDTGNATAYPSKRKGSTGNVYEVYSGVL